MGSEARSEIRISLEKLPENRALQLHGIIRQVLKNAANKQGWPTTIATTLPSGQVIPPEEFRS